MIINFQEQRAEDELKDKIALLSSTQILNVTVPELRLTYEMHSDTINSVVCVISSKEREFLKSSRGLVM